MADHKPISGKNPYTSPHNAGVAVVSGNTIHSASGRIEQNSSHGETGILGSVQSHKPVSSTDATAQIRRVKPVSGRGDQRY